MGPEINLTLKPNLTSCNPAGPIRGPFITLHFLNFNGINFGIELSVTFVYLLIENLTNHFKNFATLTPTTNLQKVSIDNLSDVDVVGTYRYLVLIVMTKVISKKRIKRIDAGTSLI